MLKLDKLDSLFFFNSLQLWDDGKKTVLAFTKTYLCMFTADVVILKQKCFLGQIRRIFLFFVPQWKPATIGRERNSLP